MSIAVSAVVLPSRLLLAMLGAMSVATAVAGIAISNGQIGELSAVARFFVFVFSIFLAAFGFYHGVRYRKPIHIDISGVGQLRLVEANAARSCADTNRPYVRGSGEAVRLLANSTIWPHLLLLRLQAESGKTTVLPILPDCVSRDSFRALSVACRWIAAHNNPSEGENS